MADNLNITEGTGTTIATDQVGSDHYQKIKLVDGTADSSTVVAVDIGVKANALRVAPANNITDGTYIGDIKFGEAEPNSAAIKTAVELLDNAIDGNYLNVNCNIAGTDIAAGEGAISAQTQRVTIATDDDGVAHLATIAGDTTSIDGKITTCNTGAVVLAAGSAAIGKLAANSGVDIGDVDVLSIAAGDNNIGNVDIVTVPAPLNIVGGGAEATALRVTLANDSTGIITVDGTITANLSATDNAVLDAIDAILDTINAKLVTGTIIGDVNLGATDNAVLDTIAGDTTSLDGKVTACNTGAVVLSSGTVTTVSTVTNLSQLGGTAISMDEGTVDAGCQRVTIATDDDGVAHLATIAGDTTNIETAIQIIDDWDAVHDSAASSDGPQVMAAYDSTKPTAVADGDAVRILADSYGRLLSGVEPTRFQAVFDSADATGEGEVVHASAASTIIVVQSYIISSDVEGWIKLQDEDSTALTGKFWLKAGGGVAITLPDKAPIVLGVDKDLEVICEAAGNVSVSVTGYTIPG